MRSGLIPSFDPPHLEAREPPQTCRRKRNVVVDSDRLGQPVFPKLRLEPLLHAVRLRREQPFAFHKVAAEEIGHCRRITVDPVAGVRVLGGAVNILDLSLADASFLQPIDLKERERPLELPDDGPAPIRECAQPRDAMARLS